MRTFLGRGQCYSRARPERRPTRTVGQNEVLFGEYWDAGFGKKRRVNRLVLQLMMLVWSANRQRGHSMTWLSSR